MTSDRDLLALILPKHDSKALPGDANSKFHNAPPATQLSHSSCISLLITEYILHVPLAVLHLHRQASESLVQAKIPLDARQHQDGMHQLLEP